MAKYDFTNEEPFKELTQAESDNIAYEQGYHDAVDKACEWLRNELPAYLGLFTSHFQDDDDVEQVVVKACVNAQIYDDLKDVMEG